MQRPQAPTTQVIEVDKNQNVVLCKSESSPGYPTGRESFCHGAVRFFEDVRSAGSTFVKRELSWTEVDIGKVNNKNLVVSLPSNAPPLMTDVKAKDEVADSTCGICADLSSCGRDAVKQLQITMKHVFMG